jgi:hypothetical protein
VHLISSHLMMRCVMGSDPELGRRRLMNVKHLHSLSGNEPSCLCVCVCVCVSLCTLSYASNMERGEASATPRPARLDSFQRRKDIIVCGPTNMKNT